MGNVGLLKLSLELGKLSLPLLVQLNLGGGVVASILKLLDKVFNVPGQERAVLLSLGAVLAFDGQLLVKLLKAALELLDLTAVLSTKGLLILDLGSHGRELLLLALDSLSKLAPDALQVSNSLLGQLQVALNLSLDLLNIRLGLLFPLQVILTLIQVLLQLALDLVQVVALVLHGLHVLLGLLLGVSNAPLFLVELGNELLLVSNLILQGTDLAVLGSLVLLACLHLGFKLLDLTTEPVSIRLDLGGLLRDSSLLLLLSLDTGHGVVQLLLNIELHGLNAVGLVNDVLDGRSTRLQSKDQLILLVHELVMLSSNLVAFSNSNLLFILSLVLGELGALEVGLDGQPQLPPEPGLTNVVVPDGALQAVEGKLLVLHLLEDNT